MSITTTLIQVGLLVAGVSCQAVYAAAVIAPLTALAPAPGAASTLSAQQANGALLARENPSQNVRDMTGWIIGSRDNRGLPFLIIDKKEAKVFVFQASGRLRAAAPALLGSALGDDSAPGIGEKPLFAILPEERTTPAGRFVATIGRNLHGTEILWVDYASAISLHPVITNNVQEQRAQRLSSPTALDNRISYGCINVPVAFFRSVVGPAFRGTYGVVYILPETRPLWETFKMPGRG